jgi:tryprostatin B 6-hydroxylase
LISDTTGSTLAAIIYELARNPGQKTKLYEELSGVFVPSSREVVHEQIAHLDHLNGIINETLRLHPPVPTALPRITPPEGIEIGETYIPGETTVYCPQYVIGHSKLLLCLASGVPTC